VAPTLEAHRKKSRAAAEALTLLDERFRFARFDPAVAFCKETLCTYAAGGNLLYFDNDHLNAEGTMFLYPALAEAMDAWREAPGAGP
jgi:lysophospholipase L1-like esterase